MSHVLMTHPMHLRLPRLIRTLTDDPGDIAEMERVERAVGDLILVGLLCRSEESEALVLPTPAALRFNEVLRAESG